MAASFARRSGPVQNAGEPFHPARIDTVARRRPYQYFLEVPHVAVHVAAVGPQIDDRISDDLPRPVVGDVATAAGLVNLDPALGQSVAAGQDM